MKLKYLGDFRMEAEHGPSGDKILTDLPVDNGGKGRNFSPTDLVGTALASCMTTTMALVGSRHGIDLKGMTVDVTKEMTNQPTRRIGKLTVTIAVADSVPADKQKLLENAAHSCPVHKSLHPDVVVDLQFKWS